MNDLQPIETAPAQGEKITKQEYLVLEKLFSKEIERALGPEWGKDLPSQIKSKYLHSLEEKGLVVKRETVLGGTLPVIVKGWELTLAGNFAYCMNCHD